MKVALIGVGFMGRGIALNIAKKAPLRSRLTVFDVKFSDAEISKSFIDEAVRESLGQISIASNPREAANEADIIALSLPNEKVTASVLFGDDGITSASNIAKGERKLVIEHGTYSRNFVLNCHARCKSAGFDYIDAPVSGGPGGAAQGSLTIMAGGDRAFFDRARPLLELYGTNLFHFGDVGAGMAAKLVNQALVAMHAAAAADAVLLAKQFGLEDLQSLQALLKSSWGQSKILDLALDDLIACQGDLEGLKNTKAPLRNLQKDVECIAADMAAANKYVDLKTFALARSAIEDACANGLKDAAFISIMERSKRRD